MSRTASKLTDRLIEEVEAQVAMGNFRSVAFARLRVSRNTWKHWVGIGRAVHRDPEGRPPPGTSEDMAERCSRLVTTLEQAEGQCQYNGLNDLRFVVSTIMQDPKATHSDRLQAVKMEQDFQRQRFSANWAHTRSNDDETGETVEVDAVAVFRDLLTKVVEHRRAEQEEGSE